MQIWRPERGDVKNGSGDPDIALALENMITRIQIRNFKSLRDVVVDLGALTVLIGRSGTGKSNFVNAIAFLKDFLLLKQGAHDRHGPPGTLTSATDANQTISFVVNFQVPGDDRCFRYKLAVNASPMPQAIEESLEHGDELLFSRDSRKWLKEPAVIPVPSPQGLALETVNGIAAVSLAYLFLTDGIGCYNFDGDVLEDGRANRPVQANRARDTGLDRAARNFLECFETINRNLHDLSAQRELIAALRQLKPTLSGIHVAMPARDRVVVSLQVGTKSLGLNLSQESEGFRRFLAHLIAIYQVPPKQVLIFEEPEKGLYPGALSALAEQLKACPAAGRGQVVLTTHNPLLLDHFSPEDIRVVDVENFETRVGHIAAEQVDALRDHLLTTGDLLTADPARVAQPEDVPA